MKSSSDRLAEEVAKGKEDVLNSQHTARIIEQFQRKGFESLSLEDLAVATIQPDFVTQFKNATGLDWQAKFQIKALERLNYAKFDINWLTRKSNDAFKPLFQSVTRGDLARVQSFIASCPKDLNYLKAVDATKKSPLHVAASDGQIAIVEFLVNRGYAPDARDRTLKTPLHYACLNGQDTCVNFLLKNGASIEAKDSIGKRAIHFASTSCSSKLIQILTGIKPDDVFSVDNSGLTALHYAIWNVTSKQVDIVRSLLDAKSNVNSVDEDGKTPLHHAAKGGKIRVIPLLIQRGANITIREKTTKKTPLELALNDRTRELIVVYTSAPLSSTKIAKEDSQWLNAAVKGETMPIERTLKEKSKSPPKKINPFEEEGSAISSWIRGRFYKLMKRLQEEGITNWHHLRKPYIYTGSWMEGIKNLEELYDLIKDIPPSEAIVRTFNILCPYDKIMPRGTGNEEAIDAFYGSSWYEGGSFNYSKRLETDKRLQDQSEVDEQINALKMALQIREQALEDSELQNQDLQRKIKDMDRLLSETKTKFNTLIEEQKRQIQAKDERGKELNQESASLREKLNRKEMELSELQANQVEISNQELKNLQDLVEKLKRENEDLKEREKIATQKAVQQAMKEKKAKEAEILLNQDIPVDDDEAIIRLYKALKNNPPSMQERMQNADVDRDSKLTQTEFMLFLEKLRISRADVQALCRVAGFSDVKKILEIKDFRNILEERPRMRQLWEQKLFKKLSEAIKAKGLQSERVFQLIDVDSNSMVTPQELRNGLDSLKIVLNQKDFNNLFSVFDVNKNGIVSLEEIRDTLLRYEGKEPELDISFADRLATDEFDLGVKINSSGNEEFNSTLRDTSKSAIKFTQDVEPINGDLKVQVPYARGLINENTIKQVTIRTMLRGSEEPDIFKSVILFDTKSWNYFVKIPVRNVLRENVNDELLVQLYSAESFSEANFLGEAKVNWKSSIDSPDSWVISQEFPLANVSFKKEITKQVTGQISIQVKWIPASSKEFKGQLVAKDMLQLEQAVFNRTIVEAGMLEFVLVSCFLQEKKKGLKGSIKTPDKKETVFDAKYDAQNQPFWSQKILTEMKPENEKNCDSIRVMIYYEEGTLFKTKNVIGDVFVNWEECINFPGEFLTRKSYLFKQHPHVTSPSKVYVQMRWIPESLYRTLGGFKQGSLADRKKDVKTSKEDLTQGILKVLLVRARDLRGDDSVDSSDPYVKLLFNNYDKQIQIVSKTKKYTVNPVWNQILQLKVSFYKEGIVPPLLVELWDKDTLSDDSLGSVAIDLTPSVQAPCTWAIDEYFQIDDQKYKAPASNPEARPKIYLQTYFVPEGTEDPNIKPKDKENELMVRDENTICGVIKVKLVHARELRKADRNGSDPYAQINLPGNKEVKSSTISNTVNPQWNETFQEKVLIAKDRLTPFKIIIKDSDLLASDDILGFVDVDWSKCVEDPGAWAVNNVFELEGTADIKQKAGTLGFVYVQVKFIEEGMIDDQSNAPLIENLAQIIAERQGLFKGTLRIFLIHCRDIVKADDGEKDFSDAYVVFKVPGGKEIKSNVIKDDQFPTWKQIYTTPIFMPKNTIQPMRVEVLDDDFIGKDMIGYLNVDLIDALNNPLKWAINKIFPLDGDQSMRKKYTTEKFGSIYLQIMFVTDGLTNEDKPLPLIEDMDELIRKKKEEAKIPMRGTLVINVVMAQNLIAADSSTKTSDPYVEILLPDKKKTSTKFIEKTLNPIWNFEYRHHIDIYQEAYQPLKFTVLDKDTLAVDDTLGEASVEWKDCFQNPTMWRINDVLELKGQSKMGQNLGKLYVQVKFLRDSDLDTVEGKTQCKTLEALQEEYGRILGNLEVQIISGANLKNTDLIGKSDPYVKAYLTTDQDNIIKTATIKDNLNPEWNLVAAIPINMLRCQLKSAELYLDVYDEDNVNDELIGRVAIDVITVLENPQKELAFEDIISDIKVKEGTNYGTLRTAFKWQPSNDCENVLGLRVPEVILKGDLYVKIVNARKLKNKSLLGKSDPLAKIGLNLFSKQTFSSKPFDNNLDPDFNFEQIIPLEITKKKAKQLLLNLNIMDKDVIGSSSMCGASISLVDLLEKSGKWFSEYVELRNNDGQTGCGHSFIQMQWRQKEPVSAEAIDTKAPEVMVYEQFLRQGEPEKFPGVLAINIIGARKLKSGFMDKSDPFTEVKISKGDKKTIKTKVIDDNENPIWNHSDQFTLELSEEDWENLKLYAAVYDYDLALNDKLGSIEISMRPFFQDKTRKWFDEILPLLNEKQFPGAGELYIQFQWRPTGETVDTNAPENRFLKEAESVQKKKEEEIKKKQEEDSEPFVKGKMFFKIIAARNLLNLDTFGASDPFVQVTFDFCKDTFSTPVITDSLDPKWDFVIEQELKYQPSKLKNPNVMFTLFDYDYNSNDFLGQIIVKADELFSKPGTWFNEIQQLQDAKCTRGRNGIFYAQMQWRPEGQTVNTTLPETLSIATFYKGANPVGTIVIAAVNAKGILGVEDKGKSSDAMLHIKYNNKVQKTKKIASLNPEWKELFKFPINFKDRSQVPFLYCELKDWNYVGDTFLGDFECDISQVLEKPNTWCIEKDFALNNLKSQKVPDDPTGTVYLKIAFIEKDKEASTVLTI